VLVVRECFIAILFIYNYLKNNKIKKNHVGFTLYTFTFITVFSVKFFRVIKMSN